MSPELITESANRPVVDTGVAVDGQSRRDTRFRPGQSGNPSGRPKNAIIRRRALRHLRAAVAEGVNQLDCVVDATIQTAIAGGSAGVAAFTAIRDTVDGKPSSADGANTGPTNITVEIALVGTQ